MIRLFKSEYEQIEKISNQRTLPVVEDVENGGYFDVGVGLHLQSVGTLVLLRQLVGVILGKVDVVVSYHIDL